MSLDYYEFKKLNNHCTYKFTNLSSKIIKKYHLNRKLFVNKKE